jgi:hypothetical protein
MGGTKLRLLGGFEGPIYSKLLKIQILKNNQSRLGSDEENIEI